MNKLTPRLVLGAAALTGLAVLGGCQQADDTITIAPAAFTEEQVQAIKTQDQLVDEEEGGAARVTRPTRVAGKGKAR